jgi:lambda repressor-like predicted transcriptional regulator
MHRADIIASLHKKGSGVCRIAEALGVHPGTVSSVIAGNDTSRRIQIAVARAVGRPVAEIWPNPTGRRRLRRAA